MGLDHDCLQYKVRERYIEPGCHLPHADGERIFFEGNLINPGETLVITNKTTDALVSLDGPENTSKLTVGDVVEFSHSPEFLLLVGATRKQ